MTETTKRNLNVCSYILNFVLMAILISVLYKQQSGSTVQPVQDKMQGIALCILEKERAELPLRIQEFEHVYDISIDSITFTNNIEPHCGYATTTWDIDEEQELNATEWVNNGCKDKYIRKKKTVYVPLNNVITDGDNVRWNINWISAYYDIKEAEK